MNRQSRIFIFLVLFLFLFNIFDDESAKSHKALNTMSRIGDTSKPLWNQLDCFRLPPVANLLKPGPRSELCELKI